MTPALLAAVVVFLLAAPAVAQEPEAKPPAIPQLPPATLGADVIATSGSFLRGDDANRRATLDGYAILNLHARDEPLKHVELWARIDNVTDAEYETAGALNFNAFADPIAVERFLAPGAPIAGFAGIRVRF